jgi:hypothetical protein
VEVATAPQIGDWNFLGELSVQDLRRLREIVRKVHMRYHPAELVTDYEADRIIESFGPEVAASLIRTGLDGGFVH